MYTDEELSAVLGEDLGTAFSGDLTLLYALAGLGVLAFLFWPRGQG